MLAEPPDFFVFAGDNVYASEPPFDVATLRAAYMELAAKPNFARVRTTVPHVAVWDDHDYGVNDGGAAFPHTQAVKDEFVRFWQLAADDPRRTRDGLYHAQAAHGRRSPRADHRSGPALVSLALATDR